MKGKLFLLLLLACMMSVQAQLVAGVDDLPAYPPAVATIVRSVDMDYSLIYVEDNNPHIDLYDHVNRNMLEFLLPSGVIVTDMEVYSGTAYFCAMAYGAIPVVGQFDIMGVFYGGDVVHYCPVRAWCNIVGYPLRLENVSRMTVYDDGSDVYIAGVGEALHNYTEPIPYVASTLFSATLRGSMWDLCVDYNKEHRYRYVDIDCTDNYVGVAAVDEHDSAWMMCYYWDNACFFMPLWKHNLGGKVEAEKIRVTGMSNDRFTLAYQPQGEERVEFVQFPTPFNPPLQKTSTLLSGNPNYTDWKLHDLRYSTVSDQVLLVGEMALPPTDIFDNWVLGYDWSGAFRAWWMALTGGLAYSIDEHIGTSLFIATALSSLNGGAQFAAEDILSPQAPWCVEEHQVYDAPLSVDTQGYNSIHDEAECGFQDNDFYPEIIKMDVMEICKSRTNTKR